MRKSNYQFLFHPVPKPGGYGFQIKITPEFREFARNQRVNQESYERYVRELIREHTQFNPEDCRHELCGWDGGLLWKVELPGNAAGLALEEQLGEWYYHPHNIDSPAQTIILLAIMSSYLETIEANIPEES